MLKKLGCDTKQTNKALLKQTGIFFALPMAVAVLHSFFGLKLFKSMLTG